MLNANRSEWNLGFNVGTEKFIDFLLESHHMRRVKFAFTARNLIMSEIG